METTIVYWGYIGIMEKKIETTGVVRVICYVGIIGGILEVCRDNGKKMEAAVWGLGIRTYGIRLEPALRVKGF